MHVIETLTSPIPSFTSSPVYKTEIMTIMVLYKIKETFASFSIIPFSDIFLTAVGNSYIALTLSQTIALSLRFCFTLSIDVSNMCTHVLFSCIMAIWKSLTNDTTNVTIKAENNRVTALITTSPIMFILFCQTSLRTRSITDIWIALSICTKKKHRGSLIVVSLSIGTMLPFRQIIRNLCLEISLNVLLAITIMSMTCWSNFVTITSSFSNASIFVHLTC